MGRITPIGPAAAYKTYSIKQPLATHWRPASCAEVDCPNYLHGWRTPLAAITEQVAHDLRAGGWHYTVERLTAVDGYAVFPPGQRCLRHGEHRRLVERDPLFVVRGGDWRGNPTGQRRVHVRAEDWVDDFATHQQHVADRHAQG